MRVPKFDPNKHKDQFPAHSPGSDHQLNKQTNNKNILIK